MTKPSNFILDTDFTTYKNDAIGSIVFTIPGSISIPVNTSYKASYSTTLGTAGAPSRAFINSSASPANWYVGQSLQVVADGIDSLFGPYQYFYIIYITRTGPNTVTANVQIDNYGFGSGTLTTETTARTITVKLATFIPPFAT